MTSRRWRGAARTRACRRRWHRRAESGAALAQRGGEVEIVEINPIHEVLGAGINQPATSLRARRAIGVLHECLGAGFQFDLATFYAASGSLDVEVPSRLGGDLPANNALTRSDLQRILLVAVDRAGGKLRRSVTVSDLRQDGDGVHVDLTEGDSGEFDLVVAFDGIRSAMRRRLFGPEHDPVFTGVGVWSARSPGAPSQAGRSTEVRAEEKKKTDSRVVATPGSAGSRQVSGPGLVS